MVVEALVQVQAAHWIGDVSAGERHEDFHAVRLIYAARCDNPRDPVVHDVGGTTASSQWVPVHSFRDVAWINGARSLLGKHGHDLVRRYRRRRSA